ncbi:MAG: quinone-dependent dihydroorotate dehydrogenase [Tatlockia sp.]|nr:quinone-dependent dihydroorotate dehydrogenase [Tatlockia sp.]
MYSLIRPLLFCLDAEKAHNLTLSALHLLPDFSFKRPAGHEVSAMGLKFPHQIGLAAGLDKNGEHLDALSKIGFSFIELGTVTPKPQIGNPKPRLFRLPEAQAIINRMGFNNQGVDVLVTNIKKAKYRGILGINIGKNKDTPLNQAAEDYLYCLSKVYNLASYVVINISSPNTPDLRLLQQEQFFRNLLVQLCEQQKSLADKYQREVPLVIKLSPDESDETLKEMAEVILELKIAGIIATNTSSSRDGVAQLRYGNEQGGVSGPPIFKRATDCLRVLKQIVGSEVSLIGVGGIENPKAAQEKLDAGADLLQIYSGLIYKGPGLVGELVAGINRHP